MLLSCRHNTLILGIKKPEAERFGRSRNTAIFHDDFADILKIRAVEPTGSDRIG